MPTLAVGMFPSETRYITTPSVAMKPATPKMEPH